MAVSIRLKRVGRKNAPYYRVVVVDSRKPRDGKCIEQLGIYQPLSAPANVKIDEERALEWLRRGAVPSKTVKDLLSQKGILSKHAAKP